MSTPVLPPRLAESLDEVRVDADTWTASVGPRELEGGRPRDLRPRLIGALYEVLHAGRAEEKDLGKIGREPDVEQLLGAAVPHELAPRRAPVLRRDEDGSAVVELAGVRTRMPAELVPANAHPGELATLHLPAARPALSHGFYLLDGPHGGPDPRGGLRRVYLHAEDPAAAARLWRPVLEHLNDAGVRYRSKALSHHEGYPRRDAVVVYLPLAAAGVAEELADAVAGLPGLAPDVSALAHRVGPGVAVADDPRDARPQYRELSFGEHRCAVLANALLRHAADPAHPLGALFAEECRAAGVRADAPAFNTPVPVPTTTAA
ncbi:T3SS effector HopA1 family protein [Nocardioides nanhaiensis]|uniref:Uncharacterized protein n=1 Tax=Nocardioides nanhaiensis TaxID=1476871 RepID=A0ABP8VRW3_9ACTN